MINLLWLVAVDVAAAFGSEIAILGLIAVFLMEIAIEVKTLRAHAATLAKVFTDPAPTMTPEREDAIAEGVVRRLRDEVRPATIQAVH